MIKLHIRTLSAILCFAVLFAGCSSRELAKPTAKANTANVTQNPFARIVTNLAGNATNVTTTIVSGPLLMG